jgi:hypothetical protein
MTNNNNTNKSHKKTHKNKQLSRKIFERRTKKITNKKLKQRAGDYSEYQDTKLLDFMKLGIGFDKHDIAPMPQPPSCSIL